MTVDPKLFLNELCAQASPRKSRSLQLIFEICEEQHERGSKDFSVVTIGRLSADRGGPTAGAIRNKTGESYRALMKVFSDSVGGRSRKAVAGAQRDEVSILLAGITDPVVRARINLLLAEMRSQRAQIIGLRHLANQNAAIVIGDAIPEISSDEAKFAQREKLSLTELEKRALKNSISDVTLVHWGWSKDDSGRILSDSGQVVFGAGFVSAVEKIMGYFE